MTTKIFWQDPYQTELDTTITNVDGNKITLAETNFYAFAGGQESDSGTIGGLPVLEARKEDVEIFYTVAGHFFQQGDTVKVAIDWERRYKLMRLHFAAEIILELVYQNLPSIEKIGAHIAQDKSRIDFQWAENIASLFPTLQAESETLINANHPIISAFSDEANERRYWEIEGFARVSCGGTHLKRTGEVGQLSLKRKNVGKAKERIEIYTY
jgi:Ser-tRNA(Ala) deacylase AlaX